MKKFFLSICLMSLVCQSWEPVYAATSTPSAVATTSANTSSPSANKAKDLLNRVSDKVTQLTDKMRRTYHGTAKTISATTITIATSNGDKNIVTNGATDFFRIKAGRQSTTDLKGIKVDDDLVAVGTIDPQTTDMTAKQVIAKIHRFNFSGTILSINEGIAEITSADNTQIKVDLTNALTLKKIVDRKIATAKLADFAEKNTVFVIAYSPDPKTEIYSSLKALVLTK